VDSVEDLIDGPIRSRGGSNIINNGLVEDFHFIEGTPAQFLNQQLLASEPVTNSIFEIPPPGLVKPLIDLHILSSGSKIRRSLAQKLKRHLDGSYSVSYFRLSIKIFYFRNMMVTEAAIAIQKI